MCLVTLIIILPLGVFGGWREWREDTSDDSLEIQRFALDNGMWTPDPKILVGPPREEDTNSHEPVQVTEAHFSTPNNTRVTVQVGSSAMLRCRVQRLAESETVTWIRRRDHHLITVGIMTYSNDDRFHVTYSPMTQDYTLHIKYAQERDSGIYECTISTHPPIGIITTLNVVQPVAEISGSPDIYAQQGSDVKLMCRLRNFTQPPTYVFWYQNDQMINYDSSKKVSVVSRGGESALHLVGVSKEASGNYSCVPANAKPAAVTLHVIPEEVPAAMQRAAARSGQGACLLVVTTAILIQLASYTG